MYTIHIFGSLTPINLVDWEVDCSLHSAKMKASKWATEYGVSSYGYNDVITVMDNETGVMLKKIRGKWIED